MKSTIIGVALLFASFFPILNAQEIVPEAQEKRRTGDPAWGKFVRPAHRYSSKESKLGGEYVPPKFTKKRILVCIYSLRQPNLWPM